MAAYFLSRLENLLIVNGRRALIGALLTSCGARSDLDVTNAGGTLGAGGQACSNCIGGASAMVGGSAPINTAGSGINSSAGGSTSTGGGSSADTTSCAYNGKVYAIGERVQTTDGCNTCTCDSTGRMMCTLVNCPETCPGLPLLSDADAGTSCIDARFVYEPPGMDIFLLVDRTKTMSYALTGTNMTRGDAIEQGVKRFVSSGAAAAYAPQVALEFFGATGNPDDPSECEAKTYTLPSVDFAPATTSGDLLLQALTAEGAYLGGQTPWLPPLHGALMYSQQWQAAHPDRKTTVVFVTDDYPTECDTDMNDIRELVGEYHVGTTGLYNAIGTPRIRTHVVGIGIDAGSRYDMDAVAQSGGTDRAVLIDGASAPDDLANLLVTMTTGVASEWPCEMPLPTPPDGQVLDLAKLTVIYTPYGGDAQRVPLIERASECGLLNGGFYFDDPNNPQEIRFCPCSCANLSGGSLAVTFECRPHSIFQ